MNLILLIGIIASVISAGYFIITEKPMGALISLLPAFVFFLFAVLLLVSVSS